LGSMGPPCRGIVFLLKWLKSEKITILVRFSTALA